MSPSGTRLEFSLTSLEYEVLAAVVTKFASDLVLFRLARPNGKAEAAALEEVATSAAVMLNDKHPATPIECLAVQAIVESVSTGSPDDFFSELCDGDLLPLAPARLKQVVRVIHGKLVASGFRAAA
jgi:hypothetical protein